MKITLIIPPSGFLMDERVFPSLGVLKVAAVLQQHHKVRVLDLSGFNEYCGAAVVSHLEDFNPDVIGITATMPQMPAVAKISGMIRELKPNLRQILGGPHPTLLYSSLRAGDRAKSDFEELTEMFDKIVVGDGEKAIFRALADDSPNIIDANFIQSELFLKSEDLDDVLPARHLINIESYKYQIDGVPTMSLIGQLGCPFGCTFCGGRSSPFLRKVRTRSTASVINEIHQLYKIYGNRGFMFLDDELNVNTQFTELLKEISYLQRQLGVDFRLRGLLKAELLTEEMATLMFEAGFRQILVGFESGSERILKNIQKKATIEDNTRCVEILQRNGIKVKALMSFGHAGESPDTINETEDWLLKVQPDDFDVTIITVYPGTPYYDKSVKSPHGPRWVYTDPTNGDKLYSFDTDQLQDENFYKGIPGNYQSYVWTDHLTREEIVRQRDAVEATVRRRLKIPYPKVAAELQFEHSMGMR